MNRRMILGAAAAALSLGAWSPAFAQEPIRIGVLEDMSGVYADITGAGSVAGAELAIEDFGGTVLGRPIELVTADHQNKADVGASIARKWFDVDGVEMITGLGNSSVALAVRGIASEKGKVDISTSAGTNALTGANCSKTGFHWVYNTYALSKTIAKSVVEAGADSMYIVAADYTFGQALADDARKFTEEAGGKVLGQVNAPLSTADYSSFILQAQSSGAKTIGLAIAGGDLVNFIKQASEFGVTEQGQAMAGFIIFVNDIKALGLNAAKGLYLAETFYWDQDDETRAMAKRYEAKTGEMPNGMQAGVYGSVLHYLKAVEAAGTTDGEAVAAKMKEMPVEDFYTKGAKIREDGRVMRDFSLYQVKAPGDSSGDWDMLTRIGTLPEGEAFQTLAEGGCPLVQ
ncbi:ABC transporter substrate-binding protein [Albimonas sp. CAU 1670]|uniref:ABC transporter substrate-binding protein n=1 Tax=Albimonas sp. CAU 1670 TaxID=3032599 RepID=UPI0023DCC327|nr:ABC transporter substrate-binding protein [Albimonas sp. CAU 1670]MDF2233977.1 ABC transporter substrate-binding protein [Albimonas sp. CAU 1670]